MHRTLTIALVLVLAVSGIRAGRTNVAAHHATIRTADTGGGVIRKGPLINTVNGPALTQQVSSTADIFLAGHTFPFSVHSTFGIDVAGRNGPACIRLQVSAGHVISVTTKSGTANGPSSPRAASADGDTGKIVLAGPTEIRGLKLGLSNLWAPINSLVGVFIGAKPNTGRAPATLNFKTAAARDAVTVRPALNQTFFIGRGVNNRNISKRYIVPNGARTLCLGSFEHIGGNHDNHGLILAFVAGAVPVQQEEPLLQPLPSITPTLTFTLTPLAPSVTSTPLTFPTDTQTLTPTPSFTETPIPSSTLTPTFTATLTPTVTLTTVPSATPTLTVTLTPTPSQTPTFPPIPTTTITPFVTSTATPLRPF